MEVSIRVRKLYLLLARSNRHTIFRVALMGSIFFSWAIISVSLYPYLSGKKTDEKSGLAGVLGIQTVAGAALISPVAEITAIPFVTPTPTITPTQTPTPIPTSTPKVRPTIKPSATPTPTTTNVNYTQYTAEKLNDVTWKVKNVTNDDRMASPTDIVNALNSYRTSQGRSSLSIDSNLSSYAQERANLFASNGALDTHAGFRNYMDNGGFAKAGFNSLGENSAYLSGPMNGDKIIRNIFGADASHDGNQLDNWTHIGVGVNGNAINVNFGKNKK